MRPLYALFLLLLGLKLAAVLSWPWTVVFIPIAVDFGLYCGQIRAIKNEDERDRRSRVDSFFSNLRK